MLESSRKRLTNAKLLGESLVNEATTDDFGERVLAEGKSLAPVTVSQHSGLKSSEAIICPTRGDREEG